MSLGAASLSAGFLYDLDQKNWFQYALLNFFATLAVYNFQRIYKASFSKIPSPWLAWVRKFKYYLLGLTFTSILLVIGLLFLLLQDLKVALSILLTTSLISFAYVVPLFGKGLRDIPFIKSPMIAFVWVVVVFLFPTLNEGISFSQILPELVAYFFFIIALTIPFDIRDLKYDDPKQNTLPMVFGINGSKFIALLIITGFYTFFVSFNENLSYNTLFFLANVCIVLLIIFSSNKRKDVYFALVDATMILVGLSYFF